MAQKPAVLKLHGSSKPFSLRRVPQAVIAIKRQLDAAPDDEIFIGEQINAIRPSQYFAEPDLEGYSLKIGTTRYWGNKKAINALRAQVGQ